MAATDYAVIAGGGDCVEVGAAAAAILVRDTKNRTGPTLTPTPTTWRALTTTLRA